MLISTFFVILSYNRLLLLQVNEFATENLLFMIELIHIKHAFVLKNYGVIKTVKPDRLRAIICDNNHCHDRCKSFPQNIIDRNNNNNNNNNNNISPTMCPGMLRTMSHSSMDDQPPPPLSLNASSQNQSLASLNELPSFNPSITPHPSDYKDTLSNDNISNDNSNGSSNSDRLRQLHTMYEDDEFEDIDLHHDYQVIDFNDVGNSNHRDSVYNSMAQNYMNVHSYLFSENGQIAARIELPSGLIVLFFGVLVCTTKYRAH